MSKYLELVEGSFNESHFNKQTNQKPYVAYSIKDGNVIYTKTPNYLCLEPIDSNNQLALAKIGDYSNIQYSFDKSNWNNFTTDPTNPLNPTFISVDKPIYLRGDNPNGILNPELLVGCKLVSSGKYNVSGDITTLLNIVGDVKDLTPYGEGSLAYIFSSIPSETSGLPIDLPSVDIVDASKLILPATTLAEYCYYSMFSDCTSLTSIPELPTTTLAKNCYDSMFNGCTSLTTAPELPATTLADDCYSDMFRGCTSLVAAPELPATELAEGCYSLMFRGCTSLTTAPELPATELADYCYTFMFEDCSSLTTAPKILPATELATSCYRGMFSNCTSLTTAPELPAMTLTEECYQWMFQICNSLNYIKCLATDISATNCTSNWVIGVAETGMFIKHPDMNSWTTGGYLDNGIPSDWKVIDAEI